MLSSSPGTQSRNNIVKHATRKHGMLLLFDVRYPCCYVVMYTYVFPKLLWPAYLVEKNSIYWYS